MTHSDSAHLLGHDPQRLAKVLDAYAGLRVLVVGDLIADEYLYGRTSRVSREAPVLILRKMKRSIAPGGASNTAHNLRALGVGVSFVGAIGDDQPGREIVEILQGKGIDTTGIVTCPELPTSTKTRILAGGHQTTYQQIVRMDDEATLQPGSVYEQRILEHLEARLPDADAVIVSDYSLGVVSTQVVAAVNRLVRRYSGVLTVDSREKLLQFGGITSVTPNEAEVEHVTGKPINDEASLHEAGYQLRESLDADHVLVTRGNNGMCLFPREGSPVEVPIYGPDQVADVTGAGDTVISAFTASLATQADPVEAMILANIAGGLSVMKVGTATVPVEELRTALLEA